MELGKFFEKNAKQPKKTPPCEIFPADVEYTALFVGFYWSFNF